MKKKAASLRRPIRDMPAFVRRALAEREGTKLKRLEQMLDELERGGVYMKMTWRPRLAS
jgi:hypothetical protein